MKRGLFSRIFAKRERPSSTTSPKSAEQTQECASLDLSDQAGRPDHLGKAADAKHAAKAAVKAGEHDKAWGLFHEQKEHYLKHAQKMGFNAEQVMRMDGSVSEDFANILRIEKRHTQALVHILYWIATSTIPIKRHDAKLAAYFARCKFQAAKLGDAQQYLRSIDGIPDFQEVQAQVANWH